MQRSPVARALSALLALWFALSVTEIASPHQCPMHDPTLGPAMAHVAAHADSHTGTYDAATHAHGERGAPAETDGHACNCIGHCSATVAVLLPGLQVATIETLVAEGRRPTFLPRLFARSVSSHLLPPATAPPHLPAA